MANDVQILDKIQRNCETIGIAVSRTNAQSLVAAGMTITYSAAVIQAPMGGIDDTINPFLGIGVANPGKIVLDTNPATLVQLQVFHIVSGMANSIVLPAGEIQGHVDMLGMGQ